VPTQRKYFGYAKYLSCLNLLFIISGLIDEIREDIGILTLLAEVLCLLDMIVNSFAHTISTKPVDRYTRPEFTGRVLALCHDFICNANFNSLVYSVFGFRLSLFMTFFCVCVCLFVYLFNYVDDGPMAINAGRHPILEGLHTDFVVRCLIFVYSYFLH
jgi:DNA mismatch repair protein MSH4